MGTPQKNAPIEWRLAASQNESTRPRLAFFRPDHQNLPSFIKLHLDEHARCLSQFFDVALVEENCDYDEVCDKVRPDLVLFESGVYARPDRRIINTHRHSGIPKLGLLNADVYCMTRSVFLSDMDEWGVENFFTISMPLRGIVPPDLGERLFIWPNFADARRFRTYPGGKPRRILFTGSHASHYPWRTRVNRLLSERFSTDRLPHGGWFDAGCTSNMLSGEPYARALSASLIAPTCGTVAHELVRKHLEIPAAGALLLTERTAAVEAAGFVDMANCVFADETDVVDKVDYLLNNPEKIEQISTAGQKLAHTRHDISHRNQIFQWYELNRQAPPGQRIVQPDPFGDMMLQAPQAKPAQAAGVGRDRALINNADKASASGRLESARSGYLAALNYHYTAEAVLGLARTDLRSGNAVRAKGLIWNSIIRCTHKHGAMEPDPVEWSVYILSLLCAGRLSLAAAASGQYGCYTHVELERARFIAHQLAGAKPFSKPDRRRLSIHPDRNLSWVAWTHDVAQMLTASGQPGLAHKVNALSTEVDPANVLDALVPAAGPRLLGLQARELRRRILPRTGFMGGPITGFRYLVRRLSGFRRRLLASVGNPPQRREIEIDNPFSELLSGRIVRTVALIGLTPADRVGEWARHVCRHSPEPCVLVAVGDVPNADTIAESILARGSDGLGDGASIPAMITEQTLVVVGAAACGLIPGHAYIGAGLVVLADIRSPSARELAGNFDANPAWCRVSLPAPVEKLGVAAWERAKDRRLATNT